MLKIQHNDTWCCFPFHSNALICVRLTGHSEELKKVFFPEETMKCRPHCPLTGLCDGGASSVALKTGQQSVGFIMGAKHSNDNISAVQLSVWGYITCVIHSFTYPLSRLSYPKPLPARAYIVSIWMVVGNQTHNLRAISSWLYTLSYRKTFTLDH